MEKTDCCGPGEKTGGIQLFSLVTVDERGQMVLPKEVREKAGIAPGDRLALVTWEKDGAICCMTLLKADTLGEMVKGVLGPMMAEVAADSAK